MESKLSPSLGAAVLTGVWVHALSVYPISDTAVPQTEFYFAFPNNKPNVGGAVTTALPFSRFPKQDIMF